MELARTRQFSECQVTRVFEKVCYRAPNGAADLQAVKTIANSFEANNRSLNACSRRPPCTAWANSKTSRARAATGESS